MYVKCKFKVISNSLQGYINLKCHFLHDFDFTLCFMPEDIEFVWSYLAKSSRIIYESDLITMSDDSRIHKHIRGFTNANQFPPLCTTIL